MAWMPELTAVPAGEFWMGNENGMDNEKPVHCVRVYGFSMGRYPVTNRQYRAFTEECAAPLPPFIHEDAFSDPDKPVVGVTWYEAVAYCDWLGKKVPGRCRLPTEAEWERAARGGIEGRLYPWGNEAPWERPFPGYDTERGGPERVGRYEPNGFGLYDLAGGVHEWCRDFYDAHYYRISPADNPQGPVSGQRRVSRGGSWRHGVKFSRCAQRSSLNPTFRYSDFGFRVVVEAREEPGA
jgi:formylglycine-generating enzyme